MPASNPHSSTFSYAGHFSPLLTCLPQDPPASPFSTGRPEVSLNWLPQQNSHLWCKHGPYPTLRKHGCRFLNHDFFLLYVHFSVTTLSAIASSNGKHYFLSHSPSSSDVLWKFSNLSKLLNGGLYLEEPAEKQREVGGIFLCFLLHRFAHSPSSTVNMSISL